MDKGFWAIVVVLAVLGWEIWMISLFGSTDGWALPLFGMFFGAVIFIAIYNRYFRS